MAKVDGSISSLIQGVSQQPARERLPGQGELQENCSSDPVNGLTRRGPTKYIDQLIESSDSYTFKDYDASSIGHFTIAYKAGEIKLFNLDGSENTVTVEGAADDYIPADGMEFIGIDENIYLLNPTKEVAMLPDTRSYVDNAAIVFLLGGQYGRDYELKVTWGANTASGTYTSPNGSTASDIGLIAPDYIASYLFGNSTDGITADTAYTAVFDTFNVSDVIYIIPKVGSGITDFTVEVTDGDGGTNIFAVQNKVSDVGRLPRFAPHGYIVRVEESATATVDDWYLEFVSDTETTLGAGFGTAGVWVETVAPGIEYKIDPETMPHILEKTGPTAFTLKQGEWADRAVGDDETNPLPSFIGETINDIGAFQGRLVLLADVNIILSRTDKFNDFFNQSATTLVDSDPIDISSALGTFVLRRLVPHNRDLILFSDRAQFIMFGRNAITPKNSSLVLTTEFEAYLGAQPVGAGRNIFFAFQYGQYSGLQEFFTDGSEDINDSRPITQHVLQYIDGNATQLVSTTNFNKLIVRTDQDEKVVYTYEYIWLNRQKAQTSWSKWMFDLDVKHMFFVDNLAYIVMQDGDSYELYSLDLDDTPDTGLTYRVLLDQKLERSGVNTTFTVPYDIDDIDNYVAVQGDGCPNPGLIALIDSYSSGTVTLKKDQAGGDIIFGRKYLSRYQPTSPFVKDRDGVKVGSGKLTIKHFVVHFDDTGYFKAIVTDDYGYSASVLYNGRVLGAPTNVIGSAAVSSGSARIPYKKNVDTSQLELQSDSHLPMSITELEWVGQWRKKGRRITGG